MFILESRVFRFLVANPNSFFSSLLSFDPSWFSNFIEFEFVTRLTNTIFEVKKIWRKLTYTMPPCSFKRIGHLICTLIFENQGLEKSRFASHLRKISGPANLDFFLGLHLEKNLDFYHKPKKIQVTNWKKNPGALDLNFFWGLKQTLISQDLDFQKSSCRLKGRMYEEFYKVFFTIYKKIFRVFFFLLQYIFVSVVYQPGNDKYPGKKFGEEIPGNHQWSLVLGVSNLAKL